MINFPNFNKRKQLNVCSRLYLPSDFLSFLLFVFSALCSHQAELTVLIFLMFSSIYAAGVLLRQDYAHTHTNAPKKINILILALQKPIILPSSVLSLSAAPFFHNIPMFPKLVIMCSDYRGCWCVSTASYTRN